MKRIRGISKWYFAHVVTLLLLSASIALGTIYYVAPGGSDTPPYTNWPMAAHNIQGAIDQTADGDTVRVSNGTYYVATEIVVTNGITLRGVNGADVTIVDGQDSTRCLRVGHTGAVVRGFTFTNGAYAGHGAGVYVGPGTVWQCVISGNEITTTNKDGGGVFVGNQAMLRECVVRGNLATGDGCCGGGVRVGGAGLIERCRIERNRANFVGGGVFCENGGVLRNCVIARNSGATYGGGVLAEETLIQNCTLSGNSATLSGGGIHPYGVCTTVNTIVYFNTAPLSNNWSAGAGFRFCNTTPSVGVACVTGDPQFVNRPGDDYRLLYISPCIDTGTNLQPAVSNDIDGVYRPDDGNWDSVFEFDIGCYEVERPTGLPKLNITNADFSVGYFEPTCGIGGTSVYCTGYLIWTNPASGDAGNHPAGPWWTISGIGLATGVNAIRVTGTNVFGTPATDTVRVTRVSAPVEVTNTLPSHATNWVARDANVVAQYAEPLDAATASSNTFLVYGAQRGFYWGTLTANSATNELTIDPSADFLPGERVHAESTWDMTNAAHTVNTYLRSWLFHAAAEESGGLLYDSGQAFNADDGRRVAFGDLDGDGDLDAFVVLHAADDTRVYTNRNGTFYDSGQRLAPGEGCSVGLGDFDRDGDLDAFVGQTYTNEVYANDGHGVFTVNQSFPGEWDCRGVAVGDLDGDGWLDAVAANNWNNPRIYLNDGTGQLVYSGQEGPPDATDADLGDINGDGYLDVLWARDGAVATPGRVWTNNGWGVFSNSGQALPDNRVRGLLGDLNGDGWLDAFLAGGGICRVWTNDRSGVLYDTGQSLNGSTFEDAALGDLDGDGDLDAYAANRSAGGGVPDKIWHNDGHGVFSLAQDGDDNANGAVALGDVDGDGDLDAFILAFDTQDAHVWLNGSPVMVALGTNGAVIANGEPPSESKGSDFGTVMVGESIAHTGFGVSNAGAVDLVLEWTTNGAGAPQFSLENLANTVSPGVRDPFKITYTPTGVGLTTAVVTFVHNGTNTPYAVCLRGEAVSPEATDVTPGNAGIDVPVDSNVTAQFEIAMDTTTITSNRCFLYSEQEGFRRGGITTGGGGTWATLDPSEDFNPGELVFGALTRGIMSTNGLGELQHRAWSFYAGVGKGSGVLIDSGQVPGTGTSRRVVLGDVNGDGWLDAFILSRGSQPDEVWTNDGNGVFCDTGQRLGSNNSQGLALGDVDNDGDLDAYVAYSDITDRLYTNDGNGFFYDSGQALATGNGRQARLNDLDGDGDLDLFVVRSGSADRVWTNDGTGTFYFDGQALEGGASRDVAIGDVNGDGFLDAFIAVDGTGNTVWTNNGNGVFTHNGQTLGTNASWGVELGDLNGDGWPDAFVVNDGGQGNTVWTNDGTGLFYDSGQRLGTNDSRDVQLGDFDADGDLDAFVGNDNGQADRIWTNDGHAVFTDSGRAYGGGDSRGVAVGDIDGDGDLDAMAATASGACEVWLNADMLGFNASAGANGTIVPSGSLTVLQGSTTSFVVTANTHYHISQLLTNGSPDAAAAGLRTYTSVWEHVMSTGRVQATFALDFFDTIYVSHAGSHTEPYTNWPSAATNLNAAMAMASDGTLVLVTNGEHLLLAEVIVSNGVTIRGVNGADVTTINGNYPVITGRCFRLTHINALLEGLTITNGMSPSSGGGAVRIVDGGTVRNCVLSGNFANNGGGAYALNGGLVANCVLRGNQATSDGGGLYLRNSGGWAMNCLITGNSAGRYGGGVYIYSGDQVRNSTICDNTATSAGDGTAVEGMGTLENCIIYYNGVQNGASIGGGPGAAYDHCCITPDPPVGGSSIVTNEPLFIDHSGGNYRLGYGSPCINSGKNLSASVTNDLDGYARPVGSLYDIGAYEYDGSFYDTDGEGLCDDDEVGLYGTSPTNVNTDGDFASDYDEMVADTDGTDSNSYFHLTGIDESASCVVTFVCTNSRMYSLQYATNMVDGSWLMVDGATNAAGDVSGTMSLTDAVESVQRSYRVGVSLP